MERIYKVKGLNCKFLSLQCTEVGLSGQAYIRLDSIDVIITEDDKHIKIYTKHYNFLVEVEDRDKLIKDISYGRDFKDTESGKYTHSMGPM